MSTSKPRRIKGLFVLVGVVGLLFGSAGPAFAAYSVTGAGTAGVGYELGPALDELCSLADPPNTFTGAQFETTYYVITDTATTYLVYDNSIPTSYYTGTVSMNIQHGDAVFAPQGAAPGECTGQALVPAPVPLTKATVDGHSVTGGAQGHLNCQMTRTNGKYERTNNAIRIEFDTECTITGNTSGLTATRSNVPMKHIVTGTQTICPSVPGGCANGDAGSKLTTTFSVSSP